MDVPGEGLDGTLLPAPLPSMERPLIRLEVEELKALGSGALQRTVATAGQLPAIHVKVAGGYDETVAKTVAVVDHRRRSLASRGAHNAPAPTKTVYRKVFRRTSNTLNITPIIDKYAPKYELDPGWYGA